MNRYGRSYQTQRRLSTGEIFNTPKKVKKSTVRSLSFRTLDNLVSLDAYDALANDRVSSSPCTGRLVESLIKPELPPYTTSVGKNKSPIKAGEQVLSLDEIDSIDINPPAKSGLLPPSGTRCKVCDKFICECKIVTQLTWEQIHWPYWGPNDMYRTPEVGKINSILLE